MICTIFIQSSVSVYFCDRGAALYIVIPQSYTYNDIQKICKRFSKTGLKYYNNRRKQYKTRQFRTMTVQMPDMAF